MATAIDPNREHPVLVTVPQLRGEIARLQGEIISNLLDEDEEWRAVESIHTAREGISALERGEKVWW